MARGAGTGVAGAIVAGTRDDGVNREGSDGGSVAPPRAVALAPDLDRPIGAWNDTDLNGWMASSRPGPSRDGPPSLVALVSEGGRVRPWRFPVDPATGRPAGAPERLIDGDVAA